jgi:cytochrome P450
VTADSAANASLVTAWANPPRLPVLSPEYQDDPHRFYREAREQSAVAVGAVGLVALSYDAARTVLRDRRFRRPDALGLAALGVTSGPLWDRAAESILSLDGEEHRRLRRLVIRRSPPPAPPNCTAR